MAEEEFPVGVCGGTEPVTRTSLLRFLDSTGPMGLDYIIHYMNVCAIDYESFVAACDHFGLKHRLVDIGYDEVGTEINARRARGARPRLPTRQTERLLWYKSQDEADARIDIYKRRVEEAEAKLRLATGAGRKKIAA